jgi:hypothetical protein
VSEAVGEQFELPKLSPLIVTCVLALTATFARSMLLMLTTGAEQSRDKGRTQHTPMQARPNPNARVSIPSKLSCPVRVAATALTLTAVRKIEPLYVCGAHATVVADVHAVLPHTSAAPIEAVGVKPKPPKLRPLMVTEPPDVTPTFGALLMLTQGAVRPTERNQTAIGEQMGHSCQCIKAACMPAIHVTHSNGC